MVETDIVTVQYLSSFDGTFRGREYSYFASCKLDVGDIVRVPTKFGTSIARVSRINVPAREIERFKNAVKTILGRPLPADQIPKVAEVPVKNNDEEREQMSLFFER